MIPKQAIKKAIEGGWEPSEFRERAYWRTRRPIRPLNRHQLSASITLHEIALDPTFWQALGKALGWAAQNSISPKWEQRGIQFCHLMLTDERADHVVLDLYRQGVINVQRIPEVLKEWDNPTFQEFDQRNAWRLFNATTFALNGRIAENPSATARLHQIIDAAIA